MEFGVDLRNRQSSAAIRPLQDLLPDRQRHPFQNGPPLPEGAPLVPAQGLFFPKIGKKDQAVSNRCFLSGAVKETT